MLFSIDEAPNIVVGKDVQIAESARFGPNVVIYPGTVIGERCTVEAGVVLGKSPQLSSRSTVESVKLEPLAIAEDVTVCSGAVIFAGTQIGRGCTVGDQAHIREQVTVGTDTVIGRAVGVENRVSIGRRVKLQSSVYITAYTVVEDDVFVGPCAVTTNDPTAGRRDSDQQLEGPKIRTAARIGAHSVLLPGIEIGRDAFVAAGAVVTSDVEPGSLVVGVPAKVRNS